MSDVAAALQKMGIELPEATPSAGNYVGFVRTGNLVFISGQIPLKDGTRQYVGKVPEQVSFEEAIQAARLCGINILTQLKAACDNDLNRVKRCVKLGGFVNASADFTKQPLVINGCSDLIVEVFGERGKHARFAVGASSLPFNVAVEVDAVFEISD
jgi:enamine deaminase RidA (YjgF/YER057c/UK114 family)